MMVLSLAPGRLPGEHRQMLGRDKSGTVALGSPGRVLVIDDYQDSADLLALLLENRGHHAAAAYDAESALIIAREFRPQVIVLDTELPGTGGWDLPARLRALPSQAECRFIAVSGYVSEADCAQCRRLGFEQHLPKPVSVEALLAAIVSSPARARATLA